jgi:hypothetical protein
MAEHVSPEIDKNAFNCPLCGAFAQQDWNYAKGYDKLTASIQGVIKWTNDIKGFAFSQCSHCHNHSIWDTNKKALIFPKNTTRNFDLTEIPKELAEDYEEACSVLFDSPKASAALSRRCLQVLLREQGFTNKSLVQEIQDVIDSNKLPSHISDSLDAIRNIGNFAAHPIKDINSGEIVPVEAGEAEWNLDVIESLFDFCYLQPAKMQARKNALNAKLKSIGKPEMK